MFRVFNDVNICRAVRRPLKNYLNLDRDKEKKEDRAKTWRYTIGHELGYLPTDRSVGSHSDRYKDREEEKPEQGVSLPGIHNVRLVGNDKEILSILNAITP